MVKWSTSSYKYIMSYKRKARKRVIFYSFQFLSKVKPTCYLLFSQVHFENESGCYSQSCQVTRYKPGCLREVRMDTHAHQFSLSVVSDSLRPLDCSTPGFPDCHQLLELAQTRVHRVGDAIQPSYPLSPSSPTFNLFPA